MLAEIRNFGVAAGLALNPDTALETVLPHLEACDLVLVMSVNAGFGGQDFNPVAIEKLATLKSQKPDHVLLEVDGGVNSHTIATCTEAARIFLLLVRQSSSKRTIKLPSTNFIRCSLRGVLIRS